MGTSLISNFRFRILAWFLLPATIGVSPVCAWWNNQWTVRKPIVLDTSVTGAAIDEPIGPAPTLLRLSDANFRFDLARPDGSDLRFVAEDDKTLLAYHIEKYDALLHEALVWVRVPDLKPSAKTNFWLYYGNPDTAVAKADDPKGTYDETTQLVYHFSEHGQFPYDFSGHSNTAQNAGAPDDAGMIGTGLLLDGKTAVTVPPEPAWAEGATVTWSAWIKFVALQPNAVIFGRRASGKAVFVAVDNGVAFVQVASAGGTLRSTGGAPLPAGKWVHLAFVATGGKFTLYADGAPYGTLSASLPALDASPIIGGNSYGSAGFVGSIDELEMSAVARSAGFIKWAAVSQGPDNTKAINVGPDGQRSNWLSALKGGYVGIIIGSLTVDGWVVIGILAIMSAVSWTVMIKKAVYLNSVSRGNTEFLQHWRQIAGDLSVLEGDDNDHARTMGGRLAVSRKGKAVPPLYRIYHLGIEEIRMRVASDSQGGSNALSARSIQAIRAVLDGGMVRETQRLNSQMVLLTIAISGGPFLGLLGTVIGVMITFAAVAAAGDVNVNAIAPGIAAALAATVAGLAVAIPSLFGYNYLLTQVKSMTSDMHVFIDEFVTRLAEFYSEPVA